MFSIRNVGDEDDVIMSSNVVLLLLRMFFKILTILMILRKKMDEGGLMHHLLLLRLLSAHQLDHLVHIADQLLTPQPKVRLASTVELDSRIFFTTGDVYGHFLVIILMVVDNEKDDYGVKNDNGDDNDIT